MSPTSARQTSSVERALALDRGRGAARDEARALVLGLLVDLGRALSHAVPYGDFVLELARARGREREHAFALRRAQSIARELALTLDRDQRLDLDRAVMFASNPARALESAREFAVARMLSRDLARAAALAVHLGTTLNWPIDSNKWIIFDRELDRARSFDRDSATKRMKQLVLCLKRARSSHAEIYKALGATVPQQSALRRERLTVSATAYRMVTLAACCLPASARHRYHEEYRAELYELASASRFAQWRYAFNLLAAALPLRAVLRQSEYEAVGQRQPR